MSKSILTETTQAINTQVDFRAVLAQIEAEDTFGAAYAAAVRTYNELVNIAGSADWNQVWETYQKAYGVESGFYAPAPGFDTAIPSEDLADWQRATWTGINPF